VRGLKKVFNRIKGLPTEIPFWRTHSKKPNSKRTSQTLPIDPSAFWLYFQVAQNISQPFSGLAEAVSK
jgi:hypothetical protein